MNFLQTLRTCDGLFNPLGDGSFNPVRWDVGIAGPNHKSGKAEIGKQLHWYAHQG